MTLNNISIKICIFYYKLHNRKKVKTLKAFKFNSTPFTMNYFVTSVVIGVVAIFAATSAQQGPCGCAPQPTVIQLSCGGGSQPNNGPSHPPPPPPPPAYTTTAAWDGDYTTQDPYESVGMCQFDEQGYPTSNYPGGFPEGFRVPVDSDGTPHPVAPEGYPVPPQNWDGRLETLGFPMPQPGTPHYNMLMCYPMPMVLAPVIGK